MVKFAGTLWLKWGEVKGGVELVGGAKQREQRVPFCHIGAEKKRLSTASAAVVKCPRDLMCDGFRTHM